jgi:Family of unknown function (DUF6318)
MRMIGVAGLVAVAAVVVAACSGGSSPAAPPSSTAASTPASTSASTSPTPSNPVTTGPNVRPGEKPPVMPPEAKQHTQEGALAFATYYYRVFDWSLATMDTQTLKMLSSSGCKSCQVHIDAIDILRNAGGHIEGGRIFIVSLIRVPAKSEIAAEYIFRAEVDQGAIVQVSAQGSRQTLSKAAKSSNNLFLSWVGTAWRMIELSAA